MDDSRVYRELMATLLRPHCRELLVADSAAAAIDFIDAEPGFGLIVCDVVMKDVDAFVVLEHLQQLDRPTTQAVMVTGFRSEDGACRARELGAAGYLQKPTTVRQILNAVREHEDAERREQHPRWRCNGTASLLDLRNGAAGPLTWDVYNISPSGAFLETKGPIPLGSEIGLLQEVSGCKATVRARVVRFRSPRGSRSAASAWNSSIRTRRPARPSPGPSRGPAGSLPRALPGPAGCASPRLKP